jgi:ribosomal protein L37AE/L43A
MNSRIKTQIKKAIGDQIIEEKHQCTDCDRTTNHKINFKIDKTTCTVCNTSTDIHEKSYEIIYKELKKIGVQF